MVYILIYRLEYHQRADVLREQQKEFFIQQQLDAIAKKFEAPLPLPLPDKQGKVHVPERKKQAEVSFSVVGDEPATSAAKTNSRHGRVSHPSLCAEGRECKYTCILYVLICA